MAILVAPRMKAFLFDAIGSLTRFDLKKGNFSDLAPVGNRFIQGEAGLEDNIANRLFLLGWLSLDPSSADSVISFLLSGGLNITRGLRFPSLRQLFGRRGQSSVGAKDLIFLHLFVWGPCGLGT